MTHRIHFIFVISLMKLHFEFDRDLQIIDVINTLLSYIIVIIGNNSGKRAYSIFVNIECLIASFQCRLPHLYYDLHICVSS